MGTKTIRSLAVLGGFLIFSSTSWPTLAAVLLPGDFSLNLCADVCTQLDASADPTTGQLNVTFPDTPVGTSASFSGLTFSGSVDPAVKGSFTLMNLSSVTQVFSVSATLGVLPFGGPTSLSGLYGPVVLTDNADDGALLVTSNFYQAQIDGTGEVNLGNFTLAAGSGSTNTRPAESFSNQLGPAVTSSIGVAFPGFSLTAGDSVMVPFEFTVAQQAQVPEPGTLALVGLAIAGMGLAKRRKLH